ncbi:DUF4188 domain-containing protein [Rubrobacter indicoceani]|uniref:DUF4188 domain-containing protein n=1 Tax=Rubrobacter indicoceani TaxID=2051957 RepID=UPI000E5A4712|nr:DUF4188 domain-containing protein [Rubrobacter indicoceani]
MKQEISNGRSTARRDEPFVVFMMGVRVNRVLFFWRWVPVLLALRAMVREMGAAPEKGCLGGETFFSWRTVTLVQYWDSYETLERYARCPESGHLPEWQRFNREVRRSGVVGLWHEAYTVGSAEYEAIYADVPVCGLARATVHMPAVGGRETRRRKGIREKLGGPVEPEATQKAV